MKRRGTNRNHQRKARYLGRNAEQSGQQLVRTITELFTTPAGHPEECEQCGRSDQFWYMENGDVRCECGIIYPQEPAS